MKPNLEVVYIALSTADPLDDASGMAEPVGNGYARVPHSDWWETPGKILRNYGKIMFAPASGAWGMITHYAIYDAPIDGDMLAHGALVESKTVAAGDDCYIASGAIRLSQLS